MRFEIAECGRMLSIAETSKEFALVVASANHNERLIKSVVAEIKNRRMPLTLRRLGVYSALFALTGALAFWLWPSAPRTIGIDASDLTIRHESYETKETLFAQLSGTQWEAALLKIRTIVINENVEIFRSDYRAYVDGIYEIVRGGRDECFKARRCYVEAVLKNLNGAETIGLAAYARRLKAHGDSDYAQKREDLNRAIVYCGEILSGSPDVRGDKAREVGVNFQKANLLMYRWLVDNAEAAKGKKVNVFPDDLNDRGVWAREEAIAIIREKAWQSELARELVRQCVDDILIPDSNLCNIIRFNGKNLGLHSKLRQEAELVSGGGR